MSIDPGGWPFEQFVNKQLVENKMTKHVWIDGPDGEQYHCPICGISKCNDYGSYDTCEKFAAFVARRGNWSYSGSAEDWSNYLLFPNTTEQINIDSAVIKETLEWLTINYAIIVITFDCGTWYIALHGINEEKHFSEAATLPAAIRLVAQKVTEHDMNNQDDKFVECPYYISQVVSPMDDRKIAEGAYIKIYDNQKGKGYHAFEGYVDIEGYARDKDGRHPFLKPGTWYAFIEKMGYVFDMSPIVIERPE